MGIPFGVCPFPTSYEGRKRSEMRKKKSKNNQSIKNVTAYKFTNLKHSGKAVMSTVFGAMSLFFMVLVSVLSYKKAGEVPSGYGFTGLFATAFAGVGMYLAVISVKDAYSYKFFGIVGIVLNGITLGFISLILYMGAYLI